MLSPQFLDFSYCSGVLKFYGAVPYRIFYSFYREFDDTVLSGNLHNHIWKAFLSYFLLYLHYTFMKTLGLTVILIFCWFSFLFYFFCLHALLSFLEDTYKYSQPSLYSGLIFCLLSLISQCFLSYDYTFCVALCYCLGNAIFSFISVKMWLDHFFKVSLS